MGLSGLKRMADTALKSKFFDYFLTIFCFFCSAYQIKAFRALIWCDLIRIFYLAFQDKNMLIKNFFIKFAHRLRRPHHG